MSRRLKLTVTGQCTLIAILAPISCMSVDESPADNSIIVQPAAFGAAGDGKTDDTRALREAIEAASGGTLELDSGRIYLISGTLEVQEPVELRGGTIKAAADIEQHIGTTGRDSLIRFASTAANSVLRDMTIDLDGAGRNAVDTEAASLRVENLTVRNYYKSSKAGDGRHATTESALRIKASDVTVDGMHCENMVTGVKDSVPRCVNIQGGARNTTLRRISGRRINGGITIASSRGTQIDGYDFRDITDNGLYLLPASEAVTARNGYLENTNEPAVFKGKNAVVSALRIHNQGHPFGLENASGVIVEDVTVTFDERLEGRPAFLRTRKKNRLSVNIRLRDISAELPLGAALFSLANGEVRDMELSDSTFTVHLQRAKRGRRFIWRQRDGDAFQVQRSTFRFEGPGAADLREVYVVAPQRAHAGRGTTDNSGNRYSAADQPIIVRYLEPGDAG